MGLRFKSQADADLETPTAPPKDLLPPADLNRSDQRFAISSGLSLAAADGASSRSLLWIAVDVGVSGSSSIESGS